MVVIIIHLLLQGGHFAFDKSILISPKPLPEPRPFTAHPRPTKTTQCHGYTMECNWEAVTLTSPIRLPRPGSSPHAIPHSQLMHHCKYSISCVWHLFWPFNDFRASRLPRRSWHSCISFTHRVTGHSHIHTPDQIRVPPRPMDKIHDHD